CQPFRDHGEYSYRGSGRLHGKAALITGETAESARPSQSHTPAKAPTSPSAICRMTARTRPRRSVRWKRPDGALWNAWQDAWPIDWPKLSGKSCPAVHSDAGTSTMAQRWFPEGKRPIGNDVAPCTAGRQASDGRGFNPARYG